MVLTPELQEQSGLRWVLDRLSLLSPFGRSAARTLRWYGPGEERALEEELANVERGMGLWEENSLALRTLIRCLTQFRDIRGCFHRDEDTPFDLVELFEIKHFLLELERLSGAYKGMKPLDGISFVPMAEVLDRLDPSGRRLPAFSVEEDWHPELPSVRAEKREAEVKLREGEDRAKWTQRRREAELRERALELEVRRDLTAELLARREVFLSNMDALGRLDLTLAKALLARRYCCVRPEIGTDGQIMLHGCVHPQVAAELEARGEEFTPVDITLRPGCTVITGANMGGKTVALRSVTLAQLLCQCGFFLFAKRGRLSLFYRVGLLLADTGPGGGGLSSFGSEVHALDSLLKESGDERFFLALDEFARGTNPQEGAALARALAEYLNECGSVSVMTTHYDGVSDGAGAHYQVTGLVREIAGDEGDDPRHRIARRMDYRLMEAKPGTPCPKDALRVCRLLGVDKKLLDCFEKNG